MVIVCGLNCMEKVTSYIKLMDFMVDQLTQNKFNVTTEHNFKSKDTDLGDYFNFF